MKLLTLGKFAAICLASLIITLEAPSAKAAKLKIDGGFVTLGTDRVIRLSQESGRYPNLGRNYYRTATIGCTSIRNTSTKGSSKQLSLEYWALPFYGAETGTPLMSVLLPAIKSGKKVSNVKKQGMAAYYNAEGYIQLRLYENSGGTWLLRASRSMSIREPL